MSYRPLTDLWICTRPKTSYYGAFPAGFLERARYLLGVTINDPVLHICGGKVREYQSGPMKGKGLGRNDCTLDLNIDLEPDFFLDARRIGTSPGDVFPYWTPGATDAQTVETGEFEITADGEAPFAYGARNPWAACLIDRPYTAGDHENYDVDADVFPENLNDLLRRALSITRIGGRVGVLDYFLPRPPKEGVQFVALVAVSTGWNQRARWYSVFERVAHNPLEFNVTGKDEETGSEDVPEPEPIETAPGSYIVGTREDFAPSPPKRRATKKKAKAKKTKKKAKTKKKTKKRAASKPAAPFAGGTPF